MHGMAQRIAARSLSAAAPPRLYHGGREVVHKLRPGSFASDRIRGAFDYARYGPNQQGRRGAGFLSVFDVASSASIESYNSFADAYKAHGVQGTMALARAAKKRGSPDLVQVYDEVIVVNPRVLSFIGGLEVPEEGTSSEVIKRLQHTKPMKG